MNPQDLFGGLLGFAVTLVVFSFLIGDNGAFRLVMHIFLGVSAGYIAVVVVYNMLWPKLLLPIMEAHGWGILRAGLPLLLSLLLFTKLSRRFSVFGTPVLAFIVGVGAAVALGGAVFGLLFPQASATINVFDFQAANQSQKNVNLALINGSVILLGTLSSLAYFHFGVRSKAGSNAQRPAVIEWLAPIGQGFIVVALGIIFAGIYAAALAALIERLSAIIAFLSSFLANLL